MLRGVVESPSSWEPSLARLCLRYSLSQVPAVVFSRAQGDRLAGPLLLMKVVEGRMLGTEVGTGEPSILITFILLMKHHDQGNLKKEGLFGA